MSDGPTILSEWLAAKPRYRRPAIGVQMPLYRRRESVTADEVVAKIKSVEWPTPKAAQVGNMVVEMIECTINEICGKNGIENEDATRR